ncbi:hypothetical protein OURE66S_03067 [Oligella ureolytica]
MAVKPQKNEGGVEMEKFQYLINKYWNFSVHLKENV